MWQVWKSLDAVRGYSPGGGKLTYWPARAADDLQLLVVISPRANSEFRRFGETLFRHHSNTVLVNGDQTKRLDLSRKCKSPGFVRLRGKTAVMIVDFAVVILTRLMAR